MSFVCAVPLHCAREEECDTDDAAQRHVGAAGGGESDEERPEAADEDEYAQVAQKAGIRGDSAVRFS